VGYCGITRDLNVRLIELSINFDYSENIEKCVDCYRFSLDK
jgi:hypothetical protein